jgi:hypothetical protein
MKPRRIFSAWVGTALFAATIGSPVAGPLDDLQPGQWYMAPNSKLSAQDPCPARNCSYSGVGGLSEIIDGWSGGAYDTQRNRLIVWGGGHADYGGNEIYVFDIATMAWTRATNPTVTTSADEAPTNQTNYYHDGTPSSRHTYNALVYAENVDLFFSLATGASYGNPPNGGFDVDSFDFDTGNWKTDWKNSPGSPYGTAGTVAAYHPGTGKIWFHGSFNSPLAVFDPTTGGGTGTWTSYRSDFIEEQAAVLLDPTRNRFIVMGNGGGIQQLIVWDLNNPDNAPLKPSTTGVSGGKAMESANGVGFVYDPVGDRYLAWNGGRNVYALNPTTWAWTAVALDTSNTVTPTAAVGRGTYGRLRYIPSKNALVVVNGVDENVYFLKLSSGSVPTPTVTFNASATSVASGGSVTLVWSSTNTTKCDALGAWSGSKAPSGTLTLDNLTTSGTYSLTCSGAGGVAEGEVTITVAGASDPLVSLVAAPSRVHYNGATVLSWSSQNVDSCTSKGGWTGTRATSGSETVSALTKSVSFELACTGAGGTQSAFALVTVGDAEVGTPPAAQKQTAGGGSFDIVVASLLAGMMVRRRRNDCARAA